ncbi:hypothetical protein [Mangrovimonas spongiae]|uniref:Uncharacterized protein n=1 Tax=Mangrovimonas spongiae TaxID=2494697 RepID=A0A3R9PHA1_9FLAO|nr:hypothetical protein [Mangrovimonas spongiae]RSK38130.1 hypothetical protein EJA19_12640 [Mangrovimonas spongiae]
MRNHLIILLLILTSCNSDKIDKAEINAFSDIEIRFRTGDERIEFYSMDIFKSGEKIKAIKKSPFYYYGSGTDSTWTTEIGKSDLKLITEFIEKAKTIKDTCSFNSSSIDYYDIKTNGKEFKIVGNCEWNGIDYDSLESKIFKHKFIELEKKREIVADSLVRSFNGIWDVSGWENGVLKNRNLVLTRTTEKEPKIDGIYRWTFEKEKEAEFKEKLDIDEGSTLIEIGASTYKVLNIENDKIELKYLW